MDPSPCASFLDTESIVQPELIDRLNRQTLLPQIGEMGRDRIASTHFLVIGAGGLGSPALQYLAASGALDLTIVDGDTVSRSNLSRQLLHDDDRIGMNKAESAAIGLRRINPFVHVTPIACFASGDNLRSLVQMADIVIDCSDNLATRLEVNDTCVTTRTPLVFGSAVGFAGQVSVFDFHQDDSPCLRCLFEPDDAKNDVRAATVGVFSPITGFIGLIQASEALKLAAGLESPLCGKLFSADLLSMRFSQIRFPRNPYCPTCGTHKVGSGIQA